MDMSKFFDAIEIDTEFGTLIIRSAMGIRNQEATLEMWYEMRKGISSYYSDKRVKNMIEKFNGEIELAKDSIEKQKFFFKRKAIAFNKINDCFSYINDVDEVIDFILSIAA